MNVKKAKANRRLVYQSNDFRDRQYFINKKTGQIIADPVRRVYQKSKRIPQAQLLHIMQTVLKDYLEKNVREVQKSAENPTAVVN